MANKKKLKKRGPRKYNLGGQQQYALPTSANATTSNMMGLGDPAVLNRQLMMSNKDVAENANRVRQQRQRQQMMEEEKSKAQVDTSKNRLMDQLKGESLSGVRTGLNTARALKGTASAAQVAQASGNSATSLLSNLGSYGSAPVGGNAAVQGIKAGLSNMGTGLGGAALGLAGSGVKHMANDNDATTMNFGETAGTLMQGAGTGLGVAGLLGGLGATGIGAPLAAIGALGYGIHGLVQKKKAQKEQDKIDEENKIRQINDSRGQSEAFNRAFTMTGSNEGFNIGNSMTNSYIPGQQVMAKYGGKKVPGGEIQGMPGGAKKFVGKSHEQGGIMLDPQTEVEGGETMDKVKMSDGDKSDYIFSKTLRLGGKSFAQRHEEILRRGGSKGRMQKKIQDLAKMQEAVAAKQGKDKNGPRDPNMIAKMQDGGQVEDKFDDTVSPGKNVLSAIPKGQSIFDDGLYTQNQGFTLNEVMDRNLWFNWEGFDPANAEDVKRFQQAYNDKVPKDSEVTVDGKFGDQTASIYLDMKEIDSIGKEDFTSKDKEGEEEVEELADKKEEPSDEVETPKSKMNMGPGTLAALSGLAQLPPKLKTPPKAAQIQPQLSGKINLPRVNYNAERAAGAAGTTSVNRAIQNQAAGPGGIAAMIANTDRQRQNNVQIANSEARANAQLMSQEAMTNAQISQQNAANAMNAQQFNAQSKYARDLENYQQNLLRQQAVGQTIAGVGRDFMGYRSDERLATALDDVGAYQRFVEQNKMNSKTENRNGGKRKYISKSNKVRRKKK